MGPKGAFFWENPNPDFRIQKRIFAFFWANPKTDHESIKSTLWVDFSDQIQIRIFEIHNLSGFLGKDLKKVFLTSGFLKNGRQQIPVCMTSIWTYVGGALLILSH